MRRDFRLHAGDVRLWGPAALVGGAATLLIFVLPLLVPSAPYHMDSAAYAAGFNSKVAVLAAAAISGAVLLAGWRGRLGRCAQEPPSSRLSVTLVATVILLSATALSLASWAVALAHVEYFRDAGYLRQQIASAALYHRHLYSEIEFLYGPLLFYGPVLLYSIVRPIGGSLTLAYFLCLILEQVLGMLALAYAMNRLPMQVAHRRWGFVLLCAGAVVDQLGLNYTHLRFALPMALLLFAMQRGSRVATVACLSAGEVIELLISPEVGVSFLLGCFAFALWNWRRDRVLAVAAAVMPALGGAAALALTPGYGKGLITFGRGAFNLPVEPLPHILIYLFAFLWLVPRSIGQRAAAASPYAAPLFALYAAAVGMAPSTLGRCDPLHVFFNGLIVLVLSLTAISGAGRRTARAWLLAIAFLVAWMQLVNLRLARMEIVNALHHSAAQLPETIRRPLLGILRPFAPTQAAVLAAPLTPAPSLDLPRLSAVVGTAAIATPFAPEPAIAEQLQQSGHYRPEYFADFENLWTEDAEQRKINDFNQAQWALLPQDMLGGWTETPKNIGDLQGFSFRYPIRRPAHLVGMLFAKNLANRWHAVADFGAYRLYRRNDS